MINRIYSLPECKEPSAEMIKAENLFNAYKDEVQLFSQTETGAVISMLDGNAIISGGIEADEVKHFLSFLRAKSVFSGSDNLKLLFEKFEVLNTLICGKPMRTLNCRGYSDDLSSSEIYNILNVDEFDLPPYEYFATDYCRRKNSGLIKVFAKRDVCAAITLESKNFRLLGGIASRQKGQGGGLLLAAISGEKPVISVCRDELLPFYFKYGFKPLYKSGFWRK